PLYVLGVKPERNEVVVDSRDELYQCSVTLGDVNWLAPAPLPGERLLVQLRYRAPAIRATVLCCVDAAITLELEGPQRAVTPGQSGVLYRGDFVVGGGRIR
ncbi:MAG: aminomethyltransferase beta-barrel domain-containing protein, partial [Longimicrobiales bacterium]